MTVEQPTPPALPATASEGENPQPAPLQQTPISRRWPRWLAGVALVVLLLGVSGGSIWYWFVREPEPSDDLGRFQGDWKLTTREGDGEDEGRTIAVRITGDRWHSVSADKEIPIFRMVVNETASPKEINLTRLDAQGNPLGEYGSHGIYTIDRKTARLAVDPVSKRRPKEFDNPESVLWILTRVRIENLPERRK